MALIGSSSPFVSLKARAEAIIKLRFQRIRKAKAGLEGEGPELPSS